MKITVITFGQVAALSASQLVLEHITDTDSLKKQIALQYPALQQIQYAVAVNNNVVHTNTPLNSASIVALLPPFSGG